MLHRLVHVGALGAQGAFDDFGVVASLDGFHLIFLVVMSLMRCRTSAELATTKRQQQSTTDKARHKAKRPKHHC